MPKIHLAQINTIVGDIDGNIARAIAAYNDAKARGSSLVIFPEQTILGYPAKDLLTLHQTILRNEEGARRFAAATAGGPAAVIGFAETHGGDGKGIYNSAALCRDGRIDAIYRKHLLPTYDVFDEDRYFDEATDITVVDVDGIRFGLTICEDLWSNSLYWSHRLYNEDPIAATAKAGAQVIVNISASPYTMSKRDARRELMAATARTHGTPVLQVNLVGANDDLVFDGSSAAVDAQGILIARAKAFEEDLVEVDLEGGTGVSPVKLSLHPTASDRSSSAGDQTVSTNMGGTPVPPSEIEDLRCALVLGIRDYVQKCRFKSVLIGLSGGIDSALVAALAAEALGPENVHGVSMPSRYSSEHSRSDARILAESLGIRFSTIAIEGMFGQCLADLESHLEGPWAGLAQENMQSRLRGVTLMSLSNASGALVLTTGNKSEMAVGYCTLYGDMCGGLAPIADVPKLLVYDLARHINARAGREVIPGNTIEKPPSAELRPDQKDTDSLPPYEILDPIVRGYIEESLDETQLIARGHDPEIVRNTLRLIDRNEYKRRQSAPTLKVTSRAFGYGWRMPIARG